MRRKPLLAVKFAGRAERTAARRCGVVILEVILVLPLLVILFFATFEFGFIGIIFTAATEAVVDGAREGSLVYPASLPYNDGNPDPTDNDDIADAIALHMNRSLAVVGLEIEKTGTGGDNLARSNAYVRIFRGGVLAERGETSISGHCMPTGPAPAANECVITLTFKLVSTPPAGHPIPNFLSTFGPLSFSNRYFNATSRYLLE